RGGRAGDRGLPARHPAFGAGAGAAARAGPGPAGGRGLRPDPAARGAGDPALWLLERARLAAAALARRGAHPARHRGRRCRDRRLPDVDGRRPGYRPGAAVPIHAHWSGGDGGRTPRPPRRPGRTGAFRRAGAAARRHPSPAAAAAGRGRHLRPQARQGRGQTGLVAAGRAAGQARARLPPVACGRGGAGRRAHPHPCRHGAGCPAFRSARHSAGGQPRRHRRRLRRGRAAPAPDPATRRQADRRCRLPQRPPRPAPIGARLARFYNGWMKKPAGTETRVAAARVLDAVLHRGRSLRAELASALPKLDDPRDRALVEAICFAALRNRARYDAALAAWMPRPLPGRERVLRGLLHAGFAQLDPLQLPAHAALAATVEAARALGRPRQAGLVNALLRRAQRDGLPPADPAAAWPEWLLARLRTDWPADVDAILAASAGPGPMWLRVNRRQGSRDAYLQRLREAGIEAAVQDGLP